MNNSPWVSQAGPPLVALEFDHHFAELAVVQVFIPDHEMEPAGVAPTPPQMVIAVELQERTPNPAGFLSLSI